MGLGCFEIIQHKPPVPFERYDRAFVADRFITIVLALPEFFVVLQYFSLRPIRPREATDHRHLVLAIHGHGVVSGRVGKSVTPGVMTAVEVGSSIAGDILTVNPQIHVELISVGGAGPEVRAADEGVGVGATEEVDATVGERMQGHDEVVKIIKVF